MPSRSPTWLVTGSSGLIGSEAVRHFAAPGRTILGLDNNLRASFFGPAADTRWNLALLREEVEGFRHVELDVRDREALFALFAEHRPEVVVHCAAQPSHDLARERPFDDFEVNAGGTLNLLEATRRHVPETPFVFLSTNKVYGDAPNELPLVELETRFELARPEHRAGIDEACRIDASMHSLFGVSKTAADLYVQEYGRYFGIPTVCFRCGCLTGPRHSGVELHGFLSHLVKTAVSGRPYTVFGYRGKQVRDQIHSHDVCTAIESWLAAPRPGDVYNLGGGRTSHGSLLECVASIEALLGRKVELRFDDRPREGDHVFYVSDTRRFEAHHPGWRLTRALPDLLEELVRAESDRGSVAAGA
jgi:CDP-paratose 2-epimerase